MPAHKLEMDDVVWPVLHKKVYGANAVDEGVAVAEPLQAPKLLALMEETDTENCCEVEMVNVVENDAPMESWMIKV